MCKGEVHLCYGAIYLGGHDRMMDNGLIEGVVEGGDGTSTMVLFGWQMDLVLYTVFVCYRTIPQYLIL